MINIKSLNLLQNQKQLKLILDNTPDYTATIYDIENEVYLRKSVVSYYEIYDINNEWSYISEISDQCIELNIIQLAYDNIKPAEPREQLLEFIVCAANKDPENNVVYPCVRHGCEIFWGLIDDKYEHGTKDCNHFEQGFLTNKYRFVNRYEAYEIALARNQIRRLCPTGSKRLYSEMLY